MSLDLKLGYWQGEMEEDCKALPTFTFGCLGFCICNRLSLRLINAPVTFQHLMQSCLGNPHLQNCIIYLDDIIIFLKMPGEHLDRL